MRHIPSKILIGTLLTCCLSTGYAININVQTNSSDVAALGFTVNGKSHGGRGTSYSATNMPNGSYSFGVRVGSALFGTDVSCLTSSGKPNVNLNRDTNATLIYNNKKCVLKIS